MFFSLVIISVFLVILVPYLSLRKETLCSQEKDFCTDYASVVVSFTLTDLQLIMTQHWPNSFEPPLQAQWVACHMTFMWTPSR